jgi:hypothetical protein
MVPCPSTRCSPRVIVQVKSGNRSSAASARNTPSIRSSSDESIVTTGWSDEMSVFSS